MKQNKVFTVFIFLQLILFACAPQGNAPSATATDQTLVEPTATLSPQTTPTLIPSNFPSLVWLPSFHSSEWHDDKVLTIRNGTGAFEPSPVDIKFFWDYTP